MVARLRVCSYDALGKHQICVKITKKRCKKLLTEPKGCGTILQKTKKVGASALTSRIGKEVNSEKRRAVVGSLFAARMLCAFAFFIFRLEVLRY